ncbi:hypothetical protein PEX1_038990 [Penicillium expansum]|nr:hypothetical protein PEXP_008870 [Penicillium expansum]KGO57317.1 hypothetical protein PEX1_038990 [Penicillium expansum]
MSERKKTRKRSKIKRWLRSWVFTPLGNVRIKLINKVERKRRSISDCELNRIVSGALTDRYPSRFFRDRNDHTSIPVRRSLLENEFDISLVDLVEPIPDQSGNPQQRSSRLDLGVGNDPLVDGGELAVPTAQPKSHDTRGSWRGDERSVLRIMNPDVSELSSEDEKAEESGAISVIEVNRNVYELSALGEMSPDLPTELSGEEKQSRQSCPILVESDFHMANPLVIAELAPQLPDLYFIHQPDPPLCCLIISTLQDSSSPVLFEGGVCSGEHSSHGPKPVIQRPLSDMSIKRANPQMNTMEFLIRQTQRKRNAIVKNRYISPFVPLQPRPLRVRKSCDITPTNTQNDVLSPIPAETSRDVTAPQDGTVLSTAIHIITTVATAHNLESLRCHTHLAPENQPTSHLAWKVYQLHPGLARSAGTVRPVDLGPSLRQWWLVLGFDLGRWIVSPPPSQTLLLNHVGLVLKAPGGFMLYLKMACPYYLLKRIVLIKVLVHLAWNCV